MSDAWAMLSWQRLFGGFGAGHGEEPGTALSSVLLCPLKLGTGAGCWTWPPPLLISSSLPVRDSGGSRGKELEPVCSFLEEHVLSQVILLQLYTWALFDGTSRSNLCPRKDMRGCDGSQLLLFCPHSVRFFSTLSKPF